MSSFVFCFAFNFNYRMLQESAFLYGTQKLTALNRVVISSQALFFCNTVTPSIFLFSTMSLYCWKSVILFFSYCVKFFALLTVFMLNFLKFGLQVYTVSEYWFLRATWCDVPRATGFASRPTPAWVAAMPSQAVPADPSLYYNFATVLRWQSAELRALCDEVSAQTTATLIVWSVRLFLMRCLLMRTADE